MLNVYCWLTRFNWRRALGPCVSIILETIGQGAGSQFGLVFPGEDRVMPRQADDSCARLFDSQRLAEAQTEALSEREC